MDWTSRDLWVGVCLGGCIVIGIELIIVFVLAWAAGVAAQGR